VSEGIGPPDFLFYRSSFSAPRWEGFGLGLKRIDPFGNALFERCGMWLKAAAIAS